MALCSALSSSSFSRPLAGELRAVDSDGVAARRLHRVHRDVGVAQQVGHRRAVAREHRDADAGGDEALLAADEDRLAHDVEDALPPRARQSRSSTPRAAARRTRRRRAGPPPPACGASASRRLERAFHDLVGVAHARAQAARHFHQQLVAGAVAQRVVDDLEAVEVDQQQRGAVVAAGARAPSARSVRQISWRRFGRPVSASKFARWRILSSATRRSVTSCTMPV
jgi:hypothetical protein